MSQRTVYPAVRTIGVILTNNAGPRFACRSAPAIIYHLCALDYAAPEEGRAVAPKHGPTTAVRLAPSDYLR